MLFERPDDSQRIVSGRNFALALVIHFALFVVFWVVAVCQGLFSKAEEIIPIDLTVVVNENLEGKENEPPPVKNPEPEKPKPKPPPKPQPKPKEPEKPKELEQIVTNIVVKVEKKKSAEAKKPEKEKPKEPEKPKKTKEQLRQERIEEMRKRAKVSNKPVKIEVKSARESGDGRTERQTRSPAEIQRLLNQGYRPGTRTQLASSVEQRCILLIQRALDEKWDSLQPSVGATGTVLLTVQFTSAGGLTNVRLERSCGDKVSDAAALSVARSVSFIQGLDPEFTAKFRREPLTIRYKVQGR